MSELLIVGKIETAPITEDSLIAENTPGYKPNTTVNDAVATCNYFIVNTSPLSERRTIFENYPAYNKKRVYEVKISINGITKVAQTQYKAALEHLPAYGNYSNYQNYLDSLQPYKHNEDQYQRVNRQTYAIKVKEALLELYDLRQHLVEDYLNYSYTHSKGPEDLDQYLEKLSAKEASLLCTYLDGIPKLISPAKYISAS